MGINDKIRDENLQYDINREIAKILALKSRKIDKYEYLTGDEILWPDKSRIIEQAKFAYSPLGKLLKSKQKQLKNQEKNKLKL